MNLWTSEEIANILIWLDERRLPFEKYSVARDGGALRLLGRGGSADVYEAKRRGTDKNNIAIKVIGFGKQHSDSAFFKESVQAQKDIGDFQDNVVRVYDHTELWVIFDEADNVISAVKENPINNQKSLKLQFIAMEKISSVFARTKDGVIHTNPGQLLEGDEQEVLKLAYDIGKALQRAHDRNILHRDIKLENVFYSPKKQQYKLGDFGIAKMTKDGFASTMAFTKGYAAPEVRGIRENDKYDNTADIYSYGIMLFILMNNMKFPGSNTYSVNANLQYSKGYIVPRPENASEQFYQIIVKLCMFDPDQRYQSMEEVLTDIGRLMYSESLSHKKRHKNVSFIVGMLMLMLGVAAWKRTLAPEMEILFSFWEYLFWGCCLGKFALRLLKKNIVWLSVVIAGIGIYLMIDGGFSWGKLILFICMTFSSGMSAGLLSVVVLTANFVYVIQLQEPIGSYSYSEYSWIAVTLISFGFVLLYQYDLLVMDGPKLVWRLYRGGLYWGMIVMLYGMVLLSGIQINRMGEEAVFTWIVRLLYDMGVDSFRVGLSGLVLCAFWIVREKVLIRNEKQKGCRPAK